MTEHALTLNSNQLGQVRALLDGTKTKHRMLIKPQPDTDEFEGPEWGNPEVVDRHGMLAPGKATFALWGPEWHIKRPWLVGDRLWVRETWMHDPAERPTGKDPTSLDYVATATPDDMADMKIRPAIHMPRWASRITLEITAIRAERVQDISEEDAKAEGIRFDGQWWLGATHEVKGTPKVSPFARQAFRTLWDSINQKRGFGWDANPHVWRLELRRIKP